MATTKNGKTSRLAAALAAEGVESTGLIHIAPLEERVARFKIVGASGYLQLAFSEKAKNTMMASQSQGSKKGTRKAREARDWDEDYRQAMHVSTEGWNGIPATAIKAAAISACRLCGVVMTRAKILLHVKPEGFDRVSGDPLVQIYGQPEKHTSAVRNATGVADIRVRAFWREWYAFVNVAYDAASIGPEDVLALLYRAGRQVGIGEGRPDSKKSCGMGLGLFDVEIA